MAIYRLKNKNLIPLDRTKFLTQEITESEIQSCIREQIETISQDTLVISEEFSDWQESRRRIDLLCLDKEANLVVVEFKRTEDGGHMELQAIRYGAMISTMTFDQVVEAHRSFLQKNRSTEDAEMRILEFLGWPEPDEDSFAQDVRIVLASAEFSKELTSAVLWLNDKGVDIRCIKMEPYLDGERIYLDMQQVIPLPETADFQIKVRRKKQKELQTKKDFSKFSLSVNGVTKHNLSKRKLMYEIVSAAIDGGSNPREIRDQLKGTKGSLFADFEGRLSESEFTDELKKADNSGIHSKTDRFFCKADQLFFYENRTYALTNQWGKETTTAADVLCSKHEGIEFEKESSEIF